MKLNYKHEAFKLQEKIDKCYRDIREFCKECMPELDQILSELQKLLYLFNLLARMQELDEFKDIKRKDRLERYYEEYKRRIGNV